MNQNKIPIIGKVLVYLSIAITVATVIWAFFEWKSLIFVSDNAISSMVGISAVILDLLFALVYIFLIIMVLKQKFWALITVTLFFVLPLIFLIFNNSNFVENFIGTNLLDYFDFFLEVLVIGYFWYFRLKLKQA